MRLLRIPGVYGPGRDSELLAGAVAEHVRAGDRVLDLFTGSGVLAVEAARAGAAEVDAIDVSRRSIAAVAINSALNGVRVQVRRGEMFAPLGDRRYDIILANPPFVPSGDDDAPAVGAARAWEAGPDGRRFLDPLIASAPSRLRPGGRLLVVHSSLCGEAATLEGLAEAGLEAEVIVRESAPLGPITAPRADALRRRGLLRGDDESEETIVVRAALPAAVDAAADATPPVAIAA
jgi:release factor glutamine methyltransferase